MKIHLIQSRDLFGPHERQEELRECWRMNEGLFDTYTHPEGRPTFSEMFALCKPDMVNCIANSDIYFDETIRLAGAITARACYALSRWDDGVLWHHLDSQDVWVIYGGPHEIGAPFTMGKPGCDNALLHILKSKGFVVTNPSKTIRCHHMHRVQWRSYLADPEGRARGGAKPERVPPPYAFCAPTEL